MSDADLDAMLRRFEIWVARNPRPQTPGHWAAGFDKLKGFKWYKVPPASKRELTLLPGIVDMVRRVSGGDIAADVAVEMAKASVAMAQEELSSSQSNRASLDRDTPDYLRFKTWALGRPRMPTIAQALAYTTEWPKQPDERKVRRWMVKLNKAESAPK
jgi:hypothetical protein